MTLTLATKHSKACPLRCCVLNERGILNYIGASKDLVDHFLAVFDVLLLRPCFTQLFCHLVTLVVENLCLARRLIQVRLHHLLAHVFVILSALKTHAFNLTLLEVKHDFDLLVRLSGLVLLFLAPAVGLNSPQLVWVIHPVEFFLCLLLLFASLHLHPPEIALRLLSLLLDPLLSLLL